MNCYISARRYYAERLIFCIVINIIRPRDMFVSDIDRRLDISKWHASMLWHDNAYDIFPAGGLYKLMFMCYTVLWCTIIIGIYNVPQANSYHLMPFHGMVCYFDAFDSSFLLSSISKEIVLIRNKNCPCIYPISPRYVTYSYSRNYVDILILLIACWFLPHARSSCWYKSSSRYVIRIVQICNLYLAEKLCIYAILCMSHNAIWCLVISVHAILIKLTINYKIDH